MGGGAGQPAPALQPASTGTNDVVEVDSPGGLSPAMEVAQVLEAAEPPTALLRLSRQHVLKRHVRELCVLKHAPLRAAGSTGRRVLLAAR